MTATTADDDDREDGPRAADLTAEQVDDLERREEEFRRRWDERGPWPVCEGDGK